MKSVRIRIYSAGLILVRIFRICTKYGGILRIAADSIRMRKDAGWDSYGCGRVLRSGMFDGVLNMVLFLDWWIWGVSCVCGGVWGGGNGRGLSFYGYGVWEPSSYFLIS